MSDETSKPKRVAFVTRDGQFGTVDASDAANMPHGTRILSAKEAKEREEDIAQQAAQAREDERYDKTPAAAKVLGGIATAASAVMPGAALTFGAGAAPGTAPAAYSSGVTEGLTGGLGQGVIRQGIDATLGKDVGDKYAQQVTDQKVASPYAHGVGNVVGTGTGLVAGAGGAAEQLATKGLARAGVQATSALGKAGVAAAKLGVRGAVEGGIIGGGEYAGRTSRIVPRRLAHVAGRESIRRCDHRGRSAWSRVHGRSRDGRIFGEARACRKSSRRSRTIRTSDAAVVGR